MRSDHNPHVGYFLQLVNGSGLQRLQRAEISRQPRRRRFTHFTDAQRIEKTRKSRRFGFFQRVYNILRGLWPHSVQAGQFTRRQTEQIRWRMDILPFHQLVDDLIAHPVYIHRPARHKMFQRLFTLRAANQPAGTTGNGFAFNALYVRSAHRTVRWKHNRTRLFRAFGQNHVDHLRDHIACPTDNHLIANAQAKSLNFIGIMQRGIADQHTSHLNRFQTRHRRNRPSAPDLKLNIAHKSHLLLSRKFKRHRPARRAGHKAQLFLQSQRVDLNHHAVDIKTERGAIFFDVAIKIQYRLGRIAQRHAIADR